MEMIKLAMADDHNLFRRGVEELIADFDNMEVIVSVSNGKLLIDRLQTLNGLPDICLLDINMPELNGFETAKQIKANWPQIKILAVSVYDSEFNIIEMLKAGANGYVLKDVQPVILRRAIENIYEQGYYHSELVAGKLLSQIVNKPAHAAITELSEKEIQFLAHCCTEMTYKEIAGEMGVSPRTVDGYRDNIFQKLNVKSRTGLVMYALKTGIAHF